MFFIRFLAVVLIVIPPNVGFAGDPPPFPEFTFKRSKPPKPGTKKRITVQVEPQEAKPEPARQDEPSDTVVPREAHYGWFWEKVSPDLGSDSATRMRAALDSLNKMPAGKGVLAPRLQTLQTIAGAEGPNILRSTIGTRVSPALVLAVIAVESSGKGDAVSNKGAQGLMQLMPDTAKRFGVTDSLAASQNIKGGVAYLEWLLNEFEGDVVMALAGYNAGENAVKKHKGVPPYTETRDYIPKVLAAFNVARGLCKTRPELITDACALNLALN